MLGGLCRRTRVIFLLVGLGAPLMARGSSYSQAERLDEIRQLVQQGNLAEAREHLVKGLKEFPKFAGFYDLLGVVEAEGKKYGSAEQDFQKAIKLDPFLIGAYLNLGHLYQQNATGDQNAPQRKGSSVIAFWKS